LRTYKHTFLYLTILFLIGGGLFYWFFERTAPSAADKFYVSSVQHRLNNALLRSKNELLVIEKQVPAQFSGFWRKQMPKTDFPYYVFQGDSLLYWSDARFVPSSKTISGNSATQFSTFQGRFFVASAKTTSNGLRLVSLIPIHERFSLSNDYLKENYNLSIFGSEPTSLRSATKGTFSLIDTDGKQLFSVVPPTQINGNYTFIPSVTLLIFIISLLFFGIFVFFMMGKHFEKHQFGRAFLWLFFFTLLARLLFFFYRFPFITYQSPIFNSGVFLDGFSLGDRLINILLLLLLVSYLATYFYRTSLFYWIYKASANIKSTFSILLIVLSYVGVWFFHGELTNVFVHSDYQLSYGLETSYDTLRFGTILYYLLLSTLLFLFTHICLRFFSRLQTSLKFGFFHWLYATLLSLILLAVVDEIRWIYGLFGIYLLLAFVYKLPRYFYILRYRTSIYFFLGALFTAIVGVNVLLFQERAKSSVDKVRFAEELLSETDPILENSIKKISNSITKDPILATAFQQKNLVRERVVEYIKRSYLDDYIGRVHAEVVVFDAENKNLDELQTTENNTDTEWLTMPENKIFKENDNYQIFIPIKKEGQAIGKIGLRLTTMLAISGEALPELLVDKRSEENPETKSYSYAFFDKNGKILFASGAYNYNEWTKEELLNPALGKQELTHKKFAHVVVKSPKGTKVIVSSIDNRFKRALSNVSYLFLISLFCILFVFVIYIFRYGFKKKVSFNFSTRIQLYLNAAFLFPLLIVVVITLTIIRTTLQSNQEKAFVATTNNLLTSIQKSIDDEAKNKMSVLFLEEELKQVAKRSKVDINLYNANGILRYSTRPLIYDYHILSSYCNPEALKLLLEDKENETLQEENIGLLNYKTVYMNVKDKNNTLLGIVGVPYFNANNQFENQIKDVISSILSVFIFLFVVLLIISYFVSKQLTEPLRVITQKIKKTDLDKLNEPLTWDSDDEIGVLTKAYNTMLRKLDENKIALSQSEKQTAWREMARQVAHEIKNPLTPMKLSIQQLQRTLPADNPPKTRERIERALNSLTEQIDNISEIANSFSEFAKMPVPRSEIFDVVPVLQKTVDLYLENKNIKINLELCEKQVNVKGDRQLMSRVVTNLIINGIQSVPATRQPMIEIKLYKNEEENFAIIEVSDNGSGIPENIRKKVFIPNFSTKVGGSGLGLAMAKRGIEHAGGNIWFESQEGLGTVFFVDIPLAKE
jgi:two-component system, NtrC family, nitrogen regulation sensor histidine kinase NtrY